MSSPALTVSPDAPLSDAIRIMIDRRVSGLPVEAATGRLVGILSEADLLRRSEVGTGRRSHHWLYWLIKPEALADDYVRANGLFVREVMSAPVHTLPEDATLQDAVTLMDRHKVKRIPILRDQEIVGIVTRWDIVKALASSLGPSYEAVLASDEEIRRNIENEIQSQTWAPASSIVVDVREGVVHLRGSVFNDGQRRGLQVIAENAPGVKEVHDHMMWVEPVSGIVLPSPEDEEQRFAGS
jgi:CBS domain-containing protein